MRPRRPEGGCGARRRLAVAALLLPLAAGCSGDDGNPGSTGPPGEPGSPPTPRELAPGEPGPGIVATITSITGGSGLGGTARVGDRLTVTFTLRKDSGAPWGLSEMDRARIMVSGPTFNYQRVVAELSDVQALAVPVGEATYRYTFASGLPATYLPPLNDGPDYGPEDGELAGQPLLAGTYTVGMAFRWDYTVGPASFNDVGNVNADFPFGNVAALAPREVVRTDGCNQCHSSLRFHGGFRREVTSCLLCHTAGMESSAPPNSVLGRTESLDFQAMVHRIHSGNALPSVQGVTTLPSGRRDYSVPPATYAYEDVEFPAWPNFWSPTPRDAGHTLLDADEQAQEDAMRSGPTSCRVCHGDPDGAGPLEAPAQGDLIYSQPSRRSCTSCHDDWIPELPYTANMQTMPPQTNDGACIVCHAETGSPLAIRDGHLHPLEDPSLAPGIRIDIDSVREQVGNMDGTLDPGEIPSVLFTLRDDAGSDLDPSTLSSMNLVVQGPTSNQQMLLNATLPLGRLAGPQPYVTTLPMQVYFEYVGDATGGADVFATALAPHWNLAGAETAVLSRTASGAATTLTQAVVPPINHVDVASAAGFARDDFVVIDDGGPAREYLRVQWVDGNRLWFSSPATPAYAPGPRLPHASGAGVQVVTLTPRTEGVDYTLDSITGTITETGDLGDGSAVVVSYVTDYRMPATYPLALNAGPDLDETDGGWAGKSLVDGTYTLALWATRSFDLDLWGETNSYREGSTDASADFLVGSAAVVEPYDLIDSAQGCYRCHQDLQFHGNNRRGWTSCLACHGTAAAGDRPRYVAANAPETEGVTVSLREMLHKIHRGSSLASDYEIVGFGFGWPDNFSVHSYEEVAFPALPGATRDCVTCHGGSGSAWLKPLDREHPTEPGDPVHNWTTVCGSCHDSSAARAHFASQTGASGAESCTFCHDPGGAYPVDLEHMIR